MIQIILEITEADGIAVNLTSKESEPTKAEKLFSVQMAKTISDFLNGAPRSVTKPPYQGDGKAGLMADMAQF